MNCVDFIGPNGVGKTTLVRQLLDNLQATRWLDQTAGRNHIARISLKNLMKPERLARSVEFAIPARRNKLVRRFRDRHAEYIIEKNEERFCEFVNLALRVIADSHLPIVIKRAEALMFYNALYDRLYLESDAEHCVALCDESISLKTQMVAMLARSPVQVEELFNSMPCPDMLVYLYGSEKAIFERLWERERKQKKSHIHFLSGNPKKTIGHLKKLTSVCSIGSEILKKRGCKVVRLNVDGLSLEQQSKFILNEFLTEKKC